jgi:hypothetical protein
LAGFFSTAWDFGNASSHYELPGGLFVVVWHMDGLGWKAFVNG